MKFRRTQDADKTGDGIVVDYHLPSEQDRKATIGCLAAVLNIMFDHHYSCNNDQNTTTTTTTKSTKRSSVSSYNTYGNGVSTRRTKEFQKELLVMSTEMLLLDPTVHVIEYLPILDTIIPGSSSDKDKDEDDGTKKTVATLTTATQLLLDPFLSSLSSAEAGFQCMSLLLFRFLLLSNNKDDGKEKVHNEKDDETTQKPPPSSPTTTILGYDSRVRYAFKFLSVSILKYWDLRGTSKSSQTASSLSAAAVVAAATKYATRKFEALEDGIAHRLSTISKQIRDANEEEEKKKKSGTDDPDTAASTTNSNIKSSTISSNTVANKNINQKNSVGKNLVRGFKIGGAALGAGALIAITGGLAVPAIVAGLATVAGISAGFAAIAGISILILPATITVFGVGSGVLVASKMNERTKGLNLTEFEIVFHGRNNQSDNSGGRNNKKKGEEKEEAVVVVEPKLSRTICINGWITDDYDFERPFGITPQSLSTTINKDNRNELFQRFCSVYAPQVIPHCDEILKEWAGKETELWEMLQSAYGTDPNSLLPLDSSDTSCMLTSDENESINSMIGHSMGIDPKLIDDANSKNNKKNNRPLHPVSLLDDVLMNKKKSSFLKKSVSSSSSSSSSSSRRFSTTAKKSDDVYMYVDNDAVEDEDVTKKKKYRSVMAWDFQSTYTGMELYTIAWEKELLIQLRGSARDLQMDIATSGIQLAIKKTIFASLMAAVVLPAALLSLTGFIDEKWTLVAERADEAGILLADSLLQSEAGHRPVNLVGISFGSRMIVSCLTELARHQKKWEKEQQQQQQQQGSSSRRKSSALLSKAGDSIRKGISNSVTTSKVGGSTNKINEYSPTYQREPASIIENVILMGCPLSITTKTWKSIRGIVAGKFINCFVGNDMMLALMYRLKNPTQIMNPPIGITEVKCVKGVTNYDVSKLVANHGEYNLAVKEILDLVGFDQPTT